MYSLAIDSWSQVASTNEANLLECSEHLLCQSTSYRRLLCLFSPASATQRLVVTVTQSNKGLIDPYYITLRVYLLLFIAKDNRVLECPLANSTKVSTCMQSTEVWPMSFEAIVVLECKYPSITLTH